MLQPPLSRLVPNRLGSRYFTATSSGYSASTSIAFRSTTKYNVAAPRAVWRGHPWLTCSQRARNVLWYEVPLSAPPSILHAPRPCAETSGQGGRSLAGR